MCLRKRWLSRNRIVSDELNSADVAQWIVRHGSNMGDAGSSPAVGTKEDEHGRMAGRRNRENAQASILGEVHPLRCGEWLPTDSR